MKTLEKVEVALVERKFREIRLIWYGHVVRCSINVSIKRRETMTNAHINRGREKFKKKIS